jgi:hypothetical protein
VTVNGEVYGSYLFSEILPALKASFTFLVLSNSVLLTLHAATLVDTDRTFLLSASPGTGKTTLALALSATGEYTLAGDDVALLNDQAHITAVPFACAVKEGSWDLLSQAYPHLVSEPVWTRADGLPVRYLPVKADRPNSAPCVPGSSYSLSETARAAPG